jgi:hypothetical protein
VFVVSECFRYLPPREWIRTDELVSAWEVERGRIMKLRNQEVGEKSSTASTTLQISLSDEEYAELRRAVSEAELPNRALLVFQAIHAGLESPEAHLSVSKRTRTINIHVSCEFKQIIRARARMYRVTQQSLLRGLLFHYIRNKRWQTTEPDTAQGEG